MRRAPQLCVLAAQPGELGQAHAGSQCRNEQCVVTTSRPGRAIRSGDERTHLGLGEIAARDGLGSLLRDREHLPDGVRMLRMAIGREAEKGVDGRQSGVAGADGVAPFGLEVIEKGAHEPGIEVCEVELAGVLARVGLGEGEQQPKSVAI